MSKQRSRRRRGIDMYPNGYADMQAQSGSHKVAQLCQQISEALSLAFACSADATLRDLSVVSVGPAPDASRLLVTVNGSDDTGQAPSAGLSEDERDYVRERQHDQILDKLQTARGYLRSEVAGAIHRKRTPDLSFRVLVGPTVSKTSG